MKKFNQKTALAFHFGANSSDIEWYQPMAGQKIRLFASGNSYYCAVKGSAPLPTGYEWKESSDNILNANDWHIFQATI